MKIEKIKIDWLEQYASAPRLEVYVDQFPDISKFRYQQKDCLFFGIQDFICSFYFYEKPGYGFGGNKITIKLEDETVKDLIGPWSSRSSVMNIYFPHSVECLLIESTTQRQIAGYSILVEELCKHLNELNLPNHLSTNQPYSICLHVNKYHSEIEYRFGFRIDGKTYISNPMFDNLFIFNYDNYLYHKKHEHI